jgi:hypothetical protein
VNSLLNYKSAPADRKNAGPFDISEVSDVSPYVDFGAIRVPPRDSLTMKLEIEETSKRVLAVTLELAHSSLQLQAFAAPRNEGLWHEVREQISASISAQGGKLEARTGSLGPELLAQVPVNNQSGQPVSQKLMRFIGVDGPRWFLRGVVSGAALTDLAASAEVDDVFRSVVVVRGETPMPPKDLLELRIPGSSGFVKN